ncbi:MAG: hypothetical protein KQ78_01771 [Candidatus Izimaplasma bacterium HR2]|nr:MAG: hypothetical protein KQ78_01771 [Candidatus Izimaplasma bacterium HR2]
MAKSEKFKELEEKLGTLNNTLKKTEKMLSTAIAMTKGDMNKSVKIGDVLKLPILVPFGDSYEFKVIKKTKTGMLDVENIDTPRIIIRVTFDVKAHEPLYGIIYEMMELYVKLEEEREKMSTGSVNLNKFRK